MYPMLKILLSNAGSNTGELAVKLGVRLPNTLYYTWPDLCQMSQCQCQMSQCGACSIGACSRYFTLSNESIWERETATGLTAGSPV